MIPAPVVFWIVCSWISSLWDARNYKLSLGRKELKTNLMFKILKGHTPSYLQNLFSLRGTRYNFRNSEVKLNLPKPHTNFLKRSLSYSGA
jgi:hypothetical protein